MSNTYIPSCIIKTKKEDTTFLQYNSLRVANAFALIFGLNTDYYRLLLEDDLTGALLTVRARMNYLRNNGEENSEEYANLAYDEDLTIWYAARVTIQTKRLLEEYALYLEKDITLDSIVKTKDFLGFIEKKGCQLPSIVAQKLQVQDAVPQELQSLYKEAAERETQGRRKYLLAVLAAANGKTNSEILKELWPNDKSSSNARNYIKKGYDVASELRLPSLDAYLVCHKRLPL